jgi:hypothetical protein
MTTTTHTPGPWYWQPTAGNHDFLICPEGPGNTIAIVRDFDEANARLIAAAPELLAAIQRIVNDNEPGEDALLTAGGYNQACAAIAKALGN